ncbi:iron chelate uptake ABC transporter family permease subunit [Haploplasma axanthum]|nr:iron chelate uptake ABC transporter family permease subunit [Haploplasma axanthum]
MSKKQKKMFLVISIILILLSLTYIFLWVFTQSDLIKKGYNPNMLSVYLKIIKRRSIQLLAIIVSTILISTSSLVFQTLTKNRILTPSILGFDAIFIVTQTLLVSLLGITSIYISNVYTNFFISVVAMIGVTLLIYKLVLSKNKNNVILLLLVGMVITSLAGSISNFIQVFMSPEEFQTVSSLTTISLTNINEQLVFVALPILLLLVFLFYRKNKVYDVMSLGDEHAIGLGVEYNRETKISLIYIAIAVAISTALIGQLMFLGLIAVNSAREIFKTNKHSILIFASSVIGFIVLMLGQVVVELFGNRTSVSVLINLIGGSYMIYLIIKENRI